MNKELTEHGSEVAGFAMDIAQELELCPFYIAADWLCCKAIMILEKSTYPKQSLTSQGSLQMKNIKVIRTHTTIGYSILKSASTDLGEYYSRGCA